MGPVPDRVDSSRVAAEGAWIFPVGDSLDLGRAVGTSPPYRITRGVSSVHSKEGRHDGADLSNRTGGGRVRAAAFGRVASVERDRRESYGYCVVLAHQLGPDTLAYSVYAHMAPGSVRVQPGELVQAGEPLGRVGSTGRATSPHLHFEVRLASDATAPWQDARPLDPVEFVRDRLPATASDTTWFAPYLAWAELNGLVARDADPLKPLRPHAWSRIVRGLAAESAAARGSSPPEAAADLADVSTDPVGWNDIARDLVLLGNARTPAPAFRANADAHRRLCAVRLGMTRPAHHPERLAARDDPPTLAEALLALADMTLEHAPARRH